MPSQGLVSVTILSGQTVSGIADLGNYILCGLFLPAAFTGIALTFQACDTPGGTFGSVRDGAGAALSKVVAGGQYIPLDQANFAGIRYLKVISGSAEGADRTIKLVGRPR